MKAAQGNDTPEQAVALAREAVRSGCVDKAAAMRLVQEFAAGPPGSFGALLVARGVTDESGVVRLRAAAASASAAAASSSPTLWLPASSGRVDPPAAARADPPAADPRGSQRLRPAPAEESHGSQRLKVTEADTGSARWGGAPEPGRSAPEPGQSATGRWPGPAASTDAPFGLSDRTLAFDAVLNRPGAPGSSEFDPIVTDLLVRPPDARLQSTATSTRDPADDGASGEPGLDSVVVDASTSGEERATGQPRPGDRLGGYALGAVLGSGGMGVIFEARKEGSERRYAVKVLLARPGPAGAARRQRFAREVEVLRRLEHPNVVRIHEAGHHGEYDWYAMDFIEGRELGDLLAQGRLSLRQRLDMFSGICRAVAHAHERGVIHRDLKPSNVLIGPTDGVHVLDFGLAKVMDDGVPQDLRLTHDGSSLGTPYYMAPEQLVSPKDVDRRADVFALGVLLYELLAGARPFVGTTAVDVSNKILNLTPPAPSKVGAGLPPALDAVCLRALEKDASARYQDVDALRRDVDKVRRTLQPARDGGAASDVGGGVGGAGVVAWLSKNRDGVIVGFVLATLLYVPLLLVILVLVRLAR